MKRFTLSKTADKDFELIFMYGIDNYGLDKATIYQNNLIDRFHRIAQEPLLNIKTTSSGRGFNV